MQPTLTVAHLFPPIAAATIINAVLFALMWRGHQIERDTGRAPWGLGGGIAAYAACLGLFLYFRRGAPAQSYPDLFGAALTAEALGALIVFALVQGFVATRGQPWRDRAFPAIAAVFLTALAFAGFFTGY